MAWTVNNIILVNARLYLPLVFLSFFLLPIYNCSTRGSERERNLAWSLFMNPLQRQRFVHWERAARGCIAHLHAMRDQYGDEAWVTKLIAEPEKGQCLTIERAIQEYLQAHHTVGHRLKRGIQRGKPADGIIEVIIGDSLLEKPTRKQLFITPSRMKHKHM